MVIVIEQKTGTVWDAQRTLPSPYGKSANPDREFWVMYRSGPTSEAMPGVVGFYSSQSDIETKLGNI